MRRQDLIESKIEGLKLRFSIPGELVTTQEEVDRFAIGFHQWMRKNDTQENAERFFHCTDSDMIEHFKKDFYL